MLRPHAPKNGNPALWVRFALDPDHAESAQSQTPEYRTLAVGAHRFGPAIPSGPWNRVPQGSCSWRR